MESAFLTAVCFVLVRYYGLARLNHIFLTVVDCVALTATCAFLLANDYALGLPVGILAALHMWALQEDVVFSKDKKDEEAEK